MNKWKAIALALMILLVSIAPSKHSDALESDPFSEPTKIRCTCYLDDGVTASGGMVRPHIMAAKPEWMGCVAELNEINEDGTVGAFIGYFEIIDTGYGAETGEGVSNIFPDRTQGTIEAGQTVDVWMPTRHQAEEWIDKYNDYVYIKLIRGVG